MTEIALETINPKVFDDPVYCNNKDEEYCKKLYRILGEYHCGLNDGKELDIEIEKPYLHVIKCQQCKDHYQRNKH
jgi:hypothetical protein